jgi:hypothetical protein
MHPAEPRCGWGAWRVEGADDDSHPQGDPKPGRGPHRDFYTDAHTQSLADGFGEPAAQR